MAEEYLRLRKKSENISDTALMEKVGKKYDLKNLLR
jgi:hypothetical protein